MEEIYIKNILKTYKMFSKRQKEILENLANTREVYTFIDLQQALQADKEAKEILGKVRFIVNGEYEKAGVYKSVPNSKPTSTTTNNNIEEIELWM